MIWASSASVQVNPRSVPLLDSSPPPRPPSISLLLSIPSKTYKKDIRIGTRTDKESSNEKKVKAVAEYLCTEQTFPAATGTQ
jgi:hypothetical protein